MYTGPNIITDGLVLALDAANVKSFPGEPTTNLLYNNGIVDWSIVNLTVNVSRTTITENSKYRITSTSYINAYTFGAFRMYVPLASLINGLTYTMSFKWKFISGSPGFSMTDWNDTSLFNVINTSYADYNYASATGVRSVYDTTYRFMDFSIPANTVIEIWDVQLEQKLYATAFVNGTRGTTVATGGGWADKSGNNNHGALVNGPIYNSNDGGSVVFDGIDDYVSQTYNMASLSEFSIDFWAKTYNTGSSGANNNAGLAGPNVGGTYIRVGFSEINQRVDILMYVNGNESNSFLSVYIPYSEFEKTEYNHYTCTIKDNDSMNIYFNGQLKKTVNIGSVITTGLTTWYQRLGNYANAFKWTGEIATSRLYSRKLTSEEIQQNYNATKSRFGL